LSRSDKLGKPRFGLGVRRIELQHAPEAVGLLFPVGEGQAEQEPALLGIRVRLDEGNEKALCGLQLPGADELKGRAQSLGQWRVHSSP
jgi:hypothetical protein